MARRARLRYERVCESKKALERLGRWHEATNVDTTTPFVAWQEIREAAQHACRLSASCFAD
jgi:hypothetical protein